MKHQNEEIRVTYNVSSTKKRNLELDTTYQAPKRGFGSWIQRIKHKKGILELDTTYQAQKRENWG